jgi:hypothetical protein
MSDNTPGGEKPAMPDNKPETGHTGKQKPASKRQQRQATEAAKIYAALPTPEDIVFLARELILCTLPHSDPGDVPAWSRKNGNLTLTIRPGWNEREKRVYGYPYGIIPRLILVWMVTEILRTRSRRLELGPRLSDFLLKLGLDPSRGGERSDARRVREQMERLFHSVISFDYSVSEGGRNAHAWASMEVVSDGVLWWSEKNPEQDSLWGSWIQVGERLHQAVLSAPSPLDIRVLRHVKDSSLGIDLYTILNREAFRAMKSGKPRFLAWEWLLIQTGNEYSGRDALNNFRKKALEQIKAIMAVHPGLIITVQKGRKGQKGGLWISNLSTPSIPPEWVEEASPVAAIASEAVPPPKQALKPATVETFRKRYPGLAPYACKAAFDAWQEGLAPENKARRYDSAFLGFAAKWAKGKA